MKYMIIFKMDNITKRIESFIVKLCFFDIRLISIPMEVSPINKAIIENRVSIYSPTFIGMKSHKDKLCLKKDFQQV